MCFYSFYIRCTSTAYSFPSYCRSSTELFVLLFPFFVEDLKNWIYIQHHQPRFAIYPLKKSLPLVPLPHLLHLRRDYLEIPQVLVSCYQPQRSFLETLQFSSSYNWLVPRVALGFNFTHLCFEINHFPAFSGAESHHTSASLPSPRLLFSLAFCFYRAFTKYFFIHASQILSHLGPWELLHASRRLVRVWVVQFQKILFSCIRVFLYCGTTNFPELKLCGCLRVRSRISYGLKILFLEIILRTMAANVEVFAFFFRYTSKALTAHCYCGKSARNGCLLAKISS